MGGGIPPGSAGRGSSNGCARRDWPRASKAASVPWITSRDHRSLRPPYHADQAGAGQPDPVEWDEKSDVGETHVDAESCKVRGMPHNARGAKFWRDCPLALATAQIRSTDGGKSRLCVTKREFRPSFSCRSVPDSSRTGIVGHLPRWRCRGHRGMRTSPAPDGRCHGDTRQSHAPSPDRGAPQPVWLSRPHGAREARGAGHELTGARSRRCRRGVAGRDARLVVHERRHGGCAATRRAAGWSPAPPRRRSARAARSWQRRRTRRSRWTSTRARGWTTSRRSPTPHFARRRTWRPGDLSVNPTRGTWALEYANAPMAWGCATGEVSSGDQRPLLAIVDEAFYNAQDPSANLGPITSTPTRLGSAIPLPTAQRSHQ